MNPPLSRLTLRANFSWTFVGSVVYAAAQWGMLVVLTKLGSPEMVGLFALGLAITMPILSFATLKTRLVQATDARQTYQFGHYFGLRLLTTAVSLFVILLVVLVVGYEPDAALVIVAVGVSKAVESISDVLYGLFQQRERMDMMAISRVIKGPLSLIALGVTVYITGSLLWGVIGLTLAWLLVLLAYDLPRCAVLLGGGTLRSAVAALRPRWELYTLGQLAWLALPLGVVV
ncbi:MAG: oligosaccharide flippase family protein, partial [Anaerolineales bacterium]|nr:oligosaccharide flippase family protein [Anaerolineales bacterium]